MTERPGEDPCPALARLEEHAAGGEAAGGPVAGHLARCEACRERLQEIRADNALLERITRLGRMQASGGAGGVDAGIVAVPGYEVLGEIHRGAQGVVYRARQLATRRTVALKVLLRGAFATTRQRLRFEREIDLAAGLDHPGIVTVYDSGTTADGRHWYAMEHVDGQPLDGFLRARKLPLRGVLGLFRSICDAVSHAHQRGVIHRDLKPANILVDGAGEPHVVDFGLARPIDPQVRGEQATVTSEGGFLGTLAYASPEQARGGTDAIDVRSDVYALGVILYEMLAGEYPYPVTGRLSDVLDAIAGTPPRPLRARREGRYRLDGELETIAGKALAKEPARRYQSAEALRRDVEHYLAGEPIDARRDSSWYVLTKTLSRYRLQAAAAAALVVLLAGFAAAMSVAWRRSELERQKLAQVNVFLEDTLGSVEPVAGQGDVTVRDMLDEGVHWVDLALSGLPEVEAAVRAIMGNGYRNIGLYEEALRQHERALEIRRGLPGGGLEVSRSLTSLGLVRRDEGRLAEARELFAEALEIRRRELGDDDLEVAMARANLALAEQRMGRLEDAERLLREALRVRVRHRGAAHPDVAMTEFLLARLMEEQGRLDEAQALHESALAKRRAALHERHPDLARSLQALGELHLRSGRPGAALPFLEECVARRAAALGPAHWRTAEAGLRLGECLAALGRSGDAEALLAPLARDAPNDALEEAARRALDRLGEARAVPGRP